MTMWQMYLLTRLDAVIALLSLIGGCAFAFSLLNGIIWGDSFGKDSGARRRSITGAMIIFLCAVLVAMIPSTKQMAVIIVAPKLYNAVSNNEALKEMPDKVVTLANEWLEELRPEKENK